MNLINKIELRGSLQTSP